MHGITKRTVLRFGSAPPPNSNSGIVSCGIPGLAWIGGCDLADASGITNPLDKNTWDESGLTLDLSKVGNVDGLPLTGIAIAPDSAVHTVDLWLGTDNDGERHRLSPGNPLVGDRLGALSSVKLTAVRSMGRDQDAISGGNAFTSDYLLNHRVWDGGDRQLPVNDGSPDLAFTWPVRLELYYGDAIPNRRHVRAPYCASWAWAVAGAGAAGTVESPGPVPGATENSEEAVFWICVDGRKLIDVIAYRTDDQAANTDITIRVYGGDSAPGMDHAAIPGQYSITQDWIAWDELDAGTFLLTPTSPGPGHTIGDDGGGNARPIRYSFRYNGAPYTFLKVVIETPHGEDPSYAKYAFGNLMINAYDA